MCPDGDPSRDALERFVQGFERQLRDVVGILQISGESLDREYVDRWVEAPGLEGLWKRALSDAGAARDA